MQVKCKEPLPKQNMTDASYYEDQFAEAVMQLSIHNAEADRDTQQKNLWALEARDRELDKLFECIYKDKVSGKLTDERFARMSERYDTEQKELAEGIKAARKALKKNATKALTEATVNTRKGVWVNYAAGQKK